MFGAVRRGRRCRSTSSWPSWSTFRSTVCGTKNHVWEGVADGTLSLEYLAKRFCKEYYFLGVWYTSEFGSLVANAPDTDAASMGSSEHFIHWIQNLADETGFAGDRNHVDMKVEWAHMLGISDEELTSYVAMPETLGMVLASCTTCAGPTRKGSPPSGGPASGSPRAPVTPR